MSRSVSIGIDEVGRGALAGPVIVGAVVIEGDCASSVQAVFAGHRPRDSKKSSAEQRKKVDQYIRNEHIFGVGRASADHIDRYGIVSALRLAATDAIQQVIQQFDSTTRFIVHADAGLFHDHSIQTTWTIRGDETVLEILLASHLAKIARDSQMKELAAQYDVYGWETNVGYGTFFHRKAIEEHGLSLEHRKTFCARLRQSVLP